MQLSTSGHEELLCCSPCHQQAVGLQNAHERCSVFLMVLVEVRATTRLALADGVPGNVKSTM